MTLREFLLNNAPRTEAERNRRRYREDWIAAVDQLLVQLRAWLTEADNSELLDIETLDFDKREQGLGSYHVRGLAIHFGERTVRVLPVGRRVVAHLGPFAQPGHQNAEGRVDVTNGVTKYTLYRTLNDAGAEEWLVQNERAEFSRLDRERFEAILQELLS